MDHAYCDVRGSSFTRADGNGFDCLHIEFQGDGPDHEGVMRFVRDELPDLANRKIRFSYSNFPWLSDWNVGKPKGCFSYLLVFFD